jgi:hypothetical protein
MHGNRVAWTDFSSILFDLIETFVRKRN